MNKKYKASSFSNVKRLKGILNAEISIVQNDNQLIKELLNTQNMPMTDSKNKSLLKLKRGSVETSRLDRNLHFKDQKQCTLYNETQSFIHKTKPIYENHSLNQSEKSYNSNQRSPNFSKFSSLTI